jgi:hypothetical protein
MVVADLAFKVKDVAIIPFRPIRMFYLCESEVC